MIIIVIFDEKFNGKLYYLEEEETYIARIRYDYKKFVMRELLEGDFIFILNFNSTEKLNSYTMLKITSLYPKHYALEAVKGIGYPSFLKDVMNNIVQDWEFEDSAETFIDCLAIPMGYDIITDNKDTELLDVIKKSSKPIPGKEIKMLSSNFLQKVFCWGLEPNNSLNLGEYLANKEINIYIDLSKMVRRHFGVFASTGSGKSNFISQLIRLTHNEYLTRTQKEIKILIFDIQGEYVALTSDILYNSGLLVISEEESFPELDTYFEDPNNSEHINNSSEVLAFQIKKPGKFEKNSKIFEHIFQNILKNQRIRRLTSEAVTVPETIEELLEFLEPPRDAGQWQTRIYNTFRRLIAESGIAGYINDERLRQLREIINGFGNIEAFTKADGSLKSNAETIIFDYENIIRTLELIRTGVQTNDFTLNDLINTYILGDGDSSFNPKIIIISITDETIMASIASRIVDTCLFRRRQNPNFNFDILFVFDEAHEYISSAQQEQTQGVRLARRSLLRLARQGRKYGLGMCIASQRTRYLDTTIMGQIHTLFAGFLPRSTDRGPLLDAFNIEADVIKEIKDFSPGMWLLCSAIATGLLQSVPVSFKAKNSEDALEDFFKDKHWI